MSKNDERVLQLKQIIDKKKTELKGSKKLMICSCCLLD